MCVQANTDGTGCPFAFFAMKRIFVLLLLLATAGASRAQEFRVYGPDAANRSRLEREAAEAAGLLKVNVCAWLSSNGALFRNRDGSTMLEGEIALPRATVVTKTWMAQNGIPPELRAILSYDRSNGAATVIYPEAPWVDCQMIFVIADTSESEASVAIAEAALDYQVAIYDLLLGAAAKRFLYEEFVQDSDKTAASIDVAKNALTRAFEMAAKRFGTELATGALPWNGNSHFSGQPWAVNLRTKFEAAKN